MNPDQQPNRSIDYLNQIAPQQKLKLLPGKWVVWGLAGALFIALLIIIIGALNQTPSLSNRATVLYVRLQTLQTISSNEQPFLKDSSLRASNGSLSLLLTNSSRDISDYLSGGGKKLTLPADLITSEKTYLDKLNAKFDDARLNVDLDSTYAREMAYQLNVVQTMMQSIYREKPDKSLESVLTTTYDNLTPLQQTFAGFSGSKE